MIDLPVSDENMQHSLYNPDFSVNIQFTPLPAARAFAKKIESQRVVVFMAEPHSIKSFIVWKIMKSRGELNKQECDSLIFPYAVQYSLSGEKKKLWYAIRISFIVVKASIKMY